MSSAKVRAPTQARVSVVIPAKNEEMSLPYVLATPWLHEVIVVDGLSRAATRGVARLCCQLSGLYRNRGAAKVTRYAKDSFTVREILS